MTTISGVLKSACERCNQARAERDRPLISLAPTFQQPFIIPYLFSLNAVNLSRSLFGLIGSIGRESAGIQMASSSSSLVRRRLAQNNGAVFGSANFIQLRCRHFSLPPALIWLAGQKFLAGRGARAGRAGKQIIFGGINCCVTKR